MLLWREELKLCISENKILLVHLKNFPSTLDQDFSYSVHYTVPLQHNCNIIPKHLHLKHLQTNLKNTYQVHQSQIIYSTVVPKGSARTSCRCERQNVNMEQQSALPRKSVSGLGQRCCKTLPMSSSKFSYCWNKCMFKIQMHWRSLNLVWNMRLWMWEKKKTVQLVKIVQEKNNFIKSCETFVMKYKILCPCPEVAIISWQRFASTE